LRLCQVHLQEKCKGCHRYEKKEGKEVSSAPQRRLLRGEGGLRFSGGARGGPGWSGNYNVPQSRRIYTEEKKGTRAQEKKKILQGAGREESAAGRGTKQPKGGPTGSKIVWVKAAPGCAKD